MTEDNSTNVLPLTLPPWGQVGGPISENKASLYSWIQRPEKSETLIDTGLKWVLISFVQVFSNEAFDQFINDRINLIALAEEELEALLGDNAVVNSFNNRGFMSTHPVYDLLLKLQKSPFPDVDKINFAQQVFFLILKYHKFMFKEQNSADLLYRVCRPARDILLCKPVTVNLHALNTTVGADEWYKAVQDLADAYEIDNTDASYVRSHLSAIIKPHSGYQEYYKRDAHTRLRLKGDWKKVSDQVLQSDRLESLNILPKDATVSTWIDKAELPPADVNIPSEDYAETRTLITSSVLPQELAQDEHAFSPPLTEPYDVKRLAIKRRGFNDAIMVNNVGRTLGSPTLSDFQLAEFILYLSKQSIKAVDRNDKAAVCFWTLKLFSGYSDRELKAIRLYTDETVYGEQLCLIKTEQILQLQLPLKSMNRKSLMVECLQLDLPNWLSELVDPFINLQLARNESSMALFSQKEEENARLAAKQFNEAREALFKTFNRQLHYQSISQAQLESYLQEALNCQHEFNRTEASYLTGKSLPGRGIPRYYLSTTAERIKQIYYSFWSKFTDQINLEIQAGQLGSKLVAFDIQNLTLHFDPQPVLGSQRQLDHDQLTNLAAFLKSKIKDYYKKQNWVQHHNYFALYCLLYLQLNTGLRAVNQPLPSYLHINFEQASLFIADKAGNNAAKARIIPLSSPVLAQLQAFKNHLQSLHNRSIVLNSGLSYLSEISSVSPYSGLHDINTRQSKISEYQQPFLFFVDDNFKPVQMNNQYIAERLPEEAQEYARNFGRHVFFNRLVNQGCSDEVISVLMGHCEHGESAHSMFSTYCDQAAREVLLTLAQGYCQIGWEPITAKLERL